jgi:metal-responsive CopG/Arc/MetJ family transcriptional regulator
MQEKSCVKISVMLTPALAALLDARALQDRRSRSNAVAVLIEQALAAEAGLAE